MRVLIFLLLLFAFPKLIKAQQNNFDKVDSLLESISEKHVKLVPDYVDFVSEKMGVLKESNLSADSKIYITQKLILHLEHLQKSFSYEINEGQEKSALNWIIEFAEIPLNDSAIVRTTIEKSMPEAYYAADIFLKEYFTLPLRKKLATLFPAEILYQLQYINTANTQNLVEIEVLAKKTPAEVKKFFHYTNNINTLLLQSKDDTIKTLYEIYKNYRFSGLSYPLLNDISKKKITVSEAENICQDNILYLNRLVDILYDNNIIGIVDVNNKITYLSNTYIKNIRYQKYASLIKTNIDQLKGLSYRVLWNFLIENQTVLDKRDILNYLSLIEPFFENNKITSEDIIIYNPFKFFGLLEKVEASEETKTLFNKMLSLPINTLLSEIRDKKANAKLWRNWKENNTQNLVSSTPSYFELVKKTTVFDKEPEERYVFINYNFEVSENEKQQIINKRDFILYREKFDSLLSNPNERELIYLLAEEEPHLILKNFNKLYKKEYSMNLLEKIAKNAPLTIKNYIAAPQNLISLTLKESDDDTIKMLFTINDSLGNTTRAYLLLDNIMKQNLSLSKANEYTQNKSVLIGKLAEIITNSHSALGKFSTNQELSYQALDFVRSLVVSENNNIDYASLIEGLDAKTLYLYIVLSEKEIIKGVYKKMLTSLHKKILYGSFLDFVDKEMNSFGMSTFFRMMAFYNQTPISDDFSQNRLKTLNALFTALEETNLGNIHTFLDIGELIVHIGYQEGFYNAIEKIIKEKYAASIKKPNNGHIAAMYGILGSLLGNKNKVGWAKQAASHFKVSNAQGLSGFELFNKDLISVQQYFFYNDEDGRASYRNFINQYAQSSFNWSITDKGDFVIIESKNGRKVLIVANKPESDESGINSVLLYLKKEGLSPYIVVHRGLSTHVLKTFNRIPASAKIILDGSCGGFQVQHVALQNAPSAQILCNRNVGTMYLNDPLFKQISEEIRMGNDIVWETFWDKMELKLGSNKYFCDYIPPHKNVSFTILEKYYTMLKIDEK